jgi:hypothetical protein
VALLHRDHEVLHASAVRHPHGVVAFCASSGTGKSTLAAAVAGSRCEFWADDFVAWDIARTTVECSWFPSVSRLDAAAAAALGSPEATPVAARPTRLAALAILSRDERVESGTTVIRRVPPARAFTAALPHAHDSRIGGQERVRRSLERYLELCRLVPVFEMAFNPDLARVADLARHVVTWMDTLPAPPSR